MEDYMLKKNTSDLTFSSSSANGPGRDSVNQTEQENAERTDPNHLLDVCLVVEGRNVCWKPGVGLTLRSLALANLGKHSL